MIVGPVTKGPPPWVTIAPHRNRAKNVGGTTTALTQKRTLSFSIPMTANMVCPIQKMKKHSRPAEVMPAFGERWLGKWAKDGQMAVIQFET